MAVRVSLNIAQVLDITQELDHLNDLVNAEIRRRGGVPKEYWDELTFEILDDLCNYIRTREGGFPGSQMKEIVHTWIADRIAEAEAGTEAEAEIEV